MTKSIESISDDVRSGIDESLLLYIENYIKYYELPHDTDVIPHILSLYQGCPIYMYDKNHLNNITSLIPNWFKCTRPIVQEIPKVNVIISSQIDGYTFMRENLHTLTEFYDKYPLSNIIPPLFIKYNKCLYINYQNEADKPIELKHKCNINSTYIVTSGILNTKYPDKEYYEPMYTFIEKYNSPKYGRLFVYEYKQKELGIPKF